MLPRCNQGISAMTPNEIRALAKLAPMDGGDVLPSPQVFSESDEKKILARLKEFGCDKSAYTVFHSHSKLTGLKSVKKICLKEQNNHSPN